VIFSSNLKVIGAIFLFAYVAWLLVMLPARTRRERTKLEEFRQYLQFQLTEMIGPYSKAPQELAGRSTLLHLEEMAESDGRIISGMNWRVISRNSEGKYWLHIIYSAGRTALIEPIGELRARRTLFNKSKAYEEAFGELPDRQRLAAKFDLGPTSETSESDVI
jgi:hypothetical protein